MIPVIGQPKLPENPKERVIKFFNTARHNNMKKLCEEFYHPKIVFKDPVGEINGLKNMVKYYLGMYENVIDIKTQFNFSF